MIKVFVGCKLKIRSSYWIIAICYLLFVTCYMPFATCYLVSDTFYRKLAIICKNMFPFARCCTSQNFAKLSLNFNFYFGWGFNFTFSNHPPNQKCIFLSLKIVINWSYETTCTTFMKIYVTCYYCYIPLT